MSVSEVPAPRLLHTIFEDRAREGPGRIALTSAGASVTYAELDARSEALAERLRALGVGPDVLVGLCAHRSPEAVVGMLGILKAGGAYVPIDPGYPEERIDFLLSDSAVPVVVVARDAAAVMTGRHPAVVWIGGDEVEVGPEVRPPAPRERSVPGERSLAYVIYTSGSTGTPKGVLVEHRNVIRLFDRTRHWFGFDHDDTWSLFHSISFDFSVWEIWGALLHGGRLVLLPERSARTPSLLLGLLRSEGVTVLNQTPTAFHQLLGAACTEDAGNAPGAGLSLRLVIFGGERLDPRMLAPWVERHGDSRPTLVNMYGITETTVHCTYRRVTAADTSGAGASVIGVPIPDLRIDLLDPRGEPVADGEVGEMHISGGGVSRGYLRRPELTRERFVRVGSVGEGGPRRYRSGDLGRRLPNGELVYLGRVDDQLKIRGFRIEPAEIEQSLSRVDGVERVVVLPRDFGGGDVRLVAHLLPVRGTVTDDLAERVERHAVRALPRHLRPSAYHVVGELPMTVQGKVDRRALAGGSQR